MQKTRILKEASEAAKLKDNSFYLYMNKDILYDWYCFLLGPEDSPFKDGIFKIKIRLGLNNMNFNNNFQTKIKIIHLFLLK